MSVRCRRHYFVTRDVIDDGAIQGKTEIWLNVTMSREESAYFMMESACDCKDVSARRQRSHSPMYAIDDLRHQCCSL